MKKPEDELPTTYSHTNDMGFRETSTVFPPCPDPPLSEKAKDAAKGISKVGWSIIIAVVGIFWAIVTHPDELQKSWNIFLQFFNGK